MDIKKTKEDLEVFKRAVNANGESLLDNAIDLLSFNPLASGKALCDLVKTGISIREEIFFEKFYLFLAGVGSSQEEAKEFIDKLFSDEQSKKENGIRLISYIDRSETEKNIQFIVNATKSLIRGWISKENYFRIARAISESMYEDLVFLSEHIMDNNTQIGNSQVLALYRAGLMVSAGIDANEDVERQPYTFASLGNMVDQFAISYGNMDRFQWHVENNRKIEFDTGMEEASDEEIFSLFEN